MDPNQVHIFVADIKKFSYGVCERSLSSEGQARLRKISKAQRRLQFLVGRYLLQEALHRLFGEIAKTWRLVEHGTNKPSLVGAGAPEFSLSHSHEQVVCAIARTQVGIDIEHQCERDIHALARYICTEDEWRDFLMLDIDHHMERFYQLWVLKEATFKALGQELATPLGFAFEGSPKLMTHFEEVEHIDLCLFTNVSGYFGALSLVGRGPYQPIFHDVAAM